MKDGKTKKTPLPVRLFTVLLICAVDLAWTAFWIYRWSHQGTLISVRNASEDAAGIFRQSLILCVVPVLTAAVCFLILKKDFASETALRVAGRKQWAFVGAPALVLFIMALAALLIKADKISVLYALLYYTVFVALTEEFLIRGACVFLLKEENAWIQYLIPNLLFAAMHVFAYGGWGEITAGYVVHFLTSQLLGTAAIGCIFQYLKEKTGTLWVPILIHAIMDFSGVFLYA